MRISRGARDPPCSPDPGEVSLLRSKRGRNANAAWVQQTKCYLTSRSPFPNRQQFFTTQYHCSCRALNGSLPSKNEEVVPTKRATAWLKEPVESALKDVSSTHTSEIDRSAMWTAYGE